MKTLSSILESIEGLREVRGDRGRGVGSVRYDSRRVGSGDLYVAVSARDDRGLEFLPAAVAAGATTIVLDAPDQVAPELLGRSDVTWVVVDDARRAMASIAHALAGNPGDRLQLYGVTGTNGKTTTTYVLRQLLETDGRKVGVIGTLGKMLDDVTPTGFTTPEPPELAEILDEMVRAGFSAVAMEVSSHALVLHRVSGLRFGGAIFTNLTQDHLDFHDSLPNYRQSKKLLFDRLDAGRPAVVNIDDLHGDAMVRDSDARVFRFGEQSRADAYINRIRFGADSTSWSLTFSESLGGGSVDLVSPLVGAFNVSNVTAAFTLALAEGLDREKLTEAVARLRPVPGRMESMTLRGGAVAVVDYAHTPDALENVLHTLRGIGNPGSRIITVFGCGGDRDRAKRPIMGTIASELSDVTIVTSDNPRSESPQAIIDEIVAGIDDHRNLECIVDRRDAIEAALEMAGPGDLVLVAGKGHETVQIVQGEHRHFDDREVVRQYDARRPARGVGDTAAA